MGQIYKLNFPNGKSYIGQTKHTALKRFQGHRQGFRNGCKKGLLYKAWSKYGEPILEVLLTVEESELGDAEIKAIKEHNTLNPNGYNLTTGGEISPMRFDCIVDKIRGQKRSEEFRKACSDRMKGKVPANKGVPMKEEQKKKLSEINKGICRPLSEETKLKLRNSALGKTKSKKHRESLSIALKKYFENNEHPLLGKTSKKTKRRSFK